MKHASLLSVLLVATVLALTGCGGGGGPDTAMGTVTTTERRLCITGEEADTSRCFTAAPELVDGLALDACVVVDYEQAGDGRLSRATAVRPGEGC